MKKKFIVLLMILFPISFALAQMPEDSQKFAPITNFNYCEAIADFNGLVKCITNSIIQPLVDLLIALALVYFFWGVIQYIRSAGGKDKDDARQILWWGVIAIFVMVSVWGLVYLLQHTFGFNEVLPNPAVPQF